MRNKCLVGEFDSFFAAPERSRLDEVERAVIVRGFDDARLDLFRLERVHEHLGIRLQAERAQLDCPRPVVRGGGDRRGGTRKGWLGGKGRRTGKRRRVGIGRGA